MVMPGGGQIYNKQILKGFVFFFWEHTLNYLAFINKAIYLDFNGHHSQALSVIDHQFALYYPGIYVLGVYDAFQDAGNEAPNKKAAIFFILGGLFGTGSIIFSNYLSIPLLFGGLSMIVPMLVGIIWFRK